MQKWEHKRIRRELNLSSTGPLKSDPVPAPVFIWDDVDEKDANRYADEMTRLKQFGIEGWELVAVLREHSDRKFTYTYYLKRPAE